MDFNEFCIKVANGLTTDTRKADIVEVAKNNEKLTGVNIKEDNHSVSPTVYLNELYERGYLVDDAIAEVERAYKNSYDKDFITAIDENNIESYIKKENLFVKIFSADNNAYLKNTVHRKFLDLVIVPFISVSNEKDRFATIKVIDNMLDMLKMSADEVIDFAIANTENICGKFIIEDISTVLTAMGAPEYEQDKLFYVGSNEIKINGANILVCGKENIRDLAKKLDTDFFIIPSSVHEVLFMPSDMGTADVFASMCHEVNETEVAPQDVLSGTIYYYDRTTDDISIA